MPTTAKSGATGGTLDEKTILTDMLMSHKFLVDCYSKATVESADPKLRDLFHQLYTECLRDQDEIFNHLHAHGWYKSPEASAQEVRKAEQRFEQTVSQMGIQS
ncbi:MAG: spore coat protein [Bacillota bacterium]